MNQRLFLALFFLLVILMATLLLAFATIPAKRTVTTVKEVPREPWEYDLSQQFAPLTIITKLPAGTTTRTDVFDASGNKIGY